DRLRSSRPTYSPASKLPTTERSKLLTTEDTGDTEEQTFPEGFYLRVLRVPRGGEFFQRGGEFPERSGEFHERWTPANVPNAAARYPTTADLSPDTSPESAYRSTKIGRAPSAFAARITATVGPPPHACSG